jgi:hypothetical protein
MSSLGGVLSTCCGAHGVSGVCADGICNVLGPIEDKQVLQPVEDA